MTEVKQSIISVNIFGIVSAVGNHSHDLQQLQIVAELATHTILRVSLTMQPMVVAALGLM